MAMESLATRKEMAWADYKLACERMKAFPKGPMGLTPDEVKATQEWKVAKAWKDATFQRLRAVNSLKA